MKHFDAIIYSANDRVTKIHIKYKLRLQYGKSMMQQTNEQLKLELTNMKRNPYLVTYAQDRRTQNTGNGKNRRTLDSAVRQTPVNRQHAKKKKHMRISRKRIWILLAGAACVFCLLLIRSFAKPDTDKAAPFGEMQTAAPVSALPDETIQGISAAAYHKHPDWTENFLTPNEYSRPGDSLNQVTNIFVHYTANKGTSAAQNRSYFEQLKDTRERSASAHFIIGYEGEIIQCIPLDEIAYAVQTRNEDSISIECCYLADDGSFTQETYDSLITLLQWLVETYDLNTEDILRHYDCGGKKCPIYYTEHDDAWEQLKKDVAAL